ncbi:hypothetical protein ACFLT1_05560 [Bacteroidota bacterium]
MTILYEKHSAYPDSILIRKFTGTIEVENIIDSWKYLLESELLTSKVMGVINDISGCELVMNMASFQVLIDYLKQQPIFRNLKLAVICTDPKTIVFPMIGERQEKDLGIKPFTTLEAAERWIFTKE